MSIANIKEVVREKYGEAALRVRSGATGSCCSAPGLESSCDPITSNLYTAAQEGELPDTAIKASLGCGNPTALAELKLVKSYSILAPEAALTCCFPLAASGQQEKPTVST